MALMVQCVNHATQVSECYGDFATVTQSAKLSYQP